MANNDDLGQRGEALFVALFTRFCNKGSPYFRCHFLGDKCPTLDFMVELIGAGKKTPFFFVQVKTTQQGYITTSTFPRLKVKVKKQDVERLLLFPAPTYVVGIDEENERGYLLAVCGTMNQTLNSLPTDFPVDCKHLKRLWTEVRDYWKNRDMGVPNSYFSA